MALKISSELVSYYDLVPTRTTLPKSDLSPLEFLIKGHDNSLINSRDIQILMKVRIQMRKPGGEPGGENLPRGYPLVPLNGFLYTMFEEVEVFVNNVRLDTTMRTYQLQVYKNLLFHTSLYEKQGPLRAACWFPDVGGEFDSVDFDAESFYTQNQRQKRIDRSSAVQFKGLLRVECLNVDKYILAGTDILLRMHPIDPKFCLMAADDGTTYLIEILQASLQVPRIFPAKAALLKTHKLLYSFTKTQLLAFTHPKGVQDFGPQTIATGQVPSKIFVAVSTEKRYQGAIEQNRLHMGNYLVESVLIKHQSAEIPYRAGYYVDYLATQMNYVDAWLGMFTELGEMRNASELPITWDSYPDGYCFYVFNMENRRTDPQPTSYSSLASGVTELTIHFAQAVDINLVVYVWNEWPFSWELSTKTGGIKVDSETRKRRKQSIADE